MRMDRQSLASAFYQRQRLLPEVGEAGQQRLSGARVLVVGAGGLGCPALTYLAAAGCGHLTIVDGDRVEASNLHRQPLFTPADIGRLKAVAARDRLRAQNPLIGIETIPRFVAPVNAASLVAGHDLVIDGTDSLVACFLLHDAAWAAGCDFVSAKLHRWEGQVFHLAFSRRQSPCLRCLWPQAPAEGCVAACAEAGVLGAVPGLFGLLLAHTALAALLDLPTPGHGSSLMVDLASFEMRRFGWAGDEDCPCCGNGQAVDSSDGIDVTLADLAPGTPIIDIREPQEMARMPLPPLPFPVLERPLSQKPEWQEEVAHTLPGAAFLCHAGSRSARLAREPTFRQAGCVSLAGGVRALLAAAEPVA